MKYKLLTDTAKEPLREYDSQGFDLFADSFAAFNYHGQVIKVGTGIALEIPKGYVGLIFPKSGLATKEGLVLKNTVGVIDSDYRGEITIAVKCDNDSLAIEQGQKIAQLLVMPVITPFLTRVENLSDTYRGDKGFGSSGK